MHRANKILNINLDDRPLWNYHLNQSKTNICRGRDLLAKLRYYLNTNTLRSLYFAIFDADLRYGS